ncbi:MAG: YkvA family protein [Lysobacteraceae bacterium]
MPITINIELSDADLEHFTSAQKAAQESAETASAEDVTAAAAKLLQNATTMHVPDFIQQRLNRLDQMIAMVRDEGWALQDDDRERVLSALLYFSNPDDMIPDSTPVLGFLDDAIMIELCVRDLQHEISAYEDFCDYRQNEAVRRGLNPAAVGRAEWLADRREELQDRMHRRRSRDYGTGYGSSSGYAKDRSYVDSGWRPSLFRAS